MGYIIMFMFVIPVGIIFYHIFKFCVWELKKDKKEKKE